VKSGRKSSRIPRPGVVGTGSTRGQSVVPGVRESKMARVTGNGKRIVKILGPGFITGASDDDPSGIGTYAMAGASLGYTTLWTALITFPLMACVQFICSKIGLVTGMGLGGILRGHYSRLIVYPLVAGLVIANTINAGADIGAIAAAIHLLLPIPSVVLIVPVGVIILVLQTVCSYRVINNVFKWLTLTLFAYVASAFLARPDWHAVFRFTLFPAVHFDGQFLSVIVAILGTTISPYLFFWQASQEVEDEVNRGHRYLWQRRGTTDGELHYAAWDTNIGMLFSNVVMYFIILASSATLFKAGETKIQSAAQAAEGLRPFAGDAATALLALGLIGSGFLAVPILTGSAAHAVAEVFGWKHGLTEKPKRARRFYIVIAASTLIGAGINFLGVNEMSALFWTAVINGFLAPPLLVAIMIIASNPDVMGSRVNGRLLNILGWSTTILMFAAVLGLLWTWNHS
jgi:NRAMP (natural resistance-associated macrophage protein)-like metal ion transporter